MEESDSLSLMTKSSEPMDEGGQRGTAGASQTNHAVSEADSTIPSFHPETSNLCLRAVSHNFILLSLLSSSPPLLSLRGSGKLVEDRAKVLRKTCVAGAKRLVS